MKKMVFFSPTKPDITSGGGLFKTRKLIRFFETNYSFRGVYLRSNGRTTSNQHELFIGLNERRYRASLFNLVKSYVNGVPISIYRNSNSLSFTQSQTIFKLCLEADIVFVDHFLMFQYVPKEFRFKVVFHEHNAEFKIWGRRAGVESNILKKALLKLESYRVGNYERKIVLNSLMTFAAPDDSIYLSNLTSHRGIFKETLHLGDDSLLAQPMNDYSVLGNTLVFLGGLDWEPNVNGVRWFLEECWLGLKEKKQDLKLNIIGKVTPEVKGELEQYSGVQCLGFVEDLNAALSEAKVFICPLLFGSGMKVKNITAMYKGLPIVTTSIGAESIDFEHTLNAIVADTTSSFSDAVLSLVEDIELCSKLGSNARKLSNTRYSWEVMLNKMNDDIQSVTLKEDAV